MKLYNILLFSVTLLAFGISGCSPDQYATKGEYDPLYFNENDRQQVKYEDEEVTSQSKTEKASYDKQGNYVYDQKSFSAKNVNPEYIAQYSKQGEAQAATNNNDSYSSGEADYYVEERDRNNEYGSRDNGKQVNVYNNNYYGGGGRGFNNSFYNRSFYDPFFNDPFFHDPHDPFYGGLGSGITFSFGYSNFRGSRSPFGYRSRFHDPFWNRPWYSRSHYGFRSPYSSYGRGFNNGYYHGFYDGIHYGNYGNSYFGGGGYWDVVSKNKRKVTSGYSSERRGGFTPASNNNNGNAEYVNGRVKSTNSGRITKEAIDNRNFESTQNEYYRRSRSDVRNEPTRDRTTRTSPVRRSSNYNDNSSGRERRGSDYNRRTRGNNRSVTPSDRRNRSKEYQRRDNNNNRDNYNRNNSNKRSNDRYQKSSSPSRNNSSWGNSNNNRSRNSGSYSNSGSNRNSSSGSRSRSSGSSSGGSSRGRR